VKNNYRDRSNTMTTNRCRRLLWAAGFVLLLATAATVDAASKLYRYTTDRGVTAIDDHVPPEFVKNGYEILSPDGRVLESVPRQLTGEEGSRKRAADAETKRLREWDKNLLLRYSSVDDIADAQNRALREIDVRISILRSNLLSAKAQVEHEQEKAADIERKGGSVPEAITSNIDTLKREVAGIEGSIVERTRDKENTRAGFQRDIDRFKTLQAVVEYRRSNSAGGGDDK
jgi:hypothetical protein